MKIVDFSFLDLVITLISVISEPINPAHSSMGYAGSVTTQW